MERMDHAHIFCLIASKCYPGPAMKPPAKALQVFAAKKEGSRSYLAGDLAGARISLP